MKHFKPHWPNPRFITLHMLSRFEFSQCAREPKMRINFGNNQSFPFSHTTSNTQTHLIYNLLPRQRTSREMAIDDVSRNRRLERSTFRVDVNLGLKRATRPPLKATTFRLCRWIMTNKRTHDGKPTGANRPVPISTPNELLLLFKHVCMWKERRFSCCVAHVN